MSHLLPSPADTLDHEEAKQRKQKKQKKPKKKQNEEEEELSKSRTNYLKPSDLTLNRIKWDATLSKELEHFVIGYKDRFLGIQEITIAEFDKSDIPQHRIYYYKFYDAIVWDREKKLDMISSGEVYKYSRNPQTPTTPLAAPQQPFPVTAQEQEQEQQHHQVEQQQQQQQQGEEDEDVGGEEQQEQGKIIFPKKKNRKIYEMYDPEDCLESWMVSVNNRALALQSPTHVSQRGGCYHIDSQHMPQLYKHWATCVQLNEKFWMEEERTHLFRAYVDIDIKLTESSPYNIIEQGWIQMIAQLASDYFEQSFGGAVDTSCLVTECHSDWSDSTTTSARFKSGYRLYFLAIYVDTETLTEFVKTIARKLKKVFDKYTGQPKDWTFTDVIDVDSCKHTKARMFGTVKFRRGNEIPRRYSFAGLFANKTGELNQPLTNFLKKVENTEALVRLSSVRLEKDGQSASQDQQHLLDSVMISKKGSQRIKVPLFGIDLALLQQ